MWGSDRFKKKEKEKGVDVEWVSALFFALKSTLIYSKGLIV